MISWCDGEAVAMVEASVLTPRVLTSTGLIIFNFPQDKHPRLFQCRLLLYLSGYGVTNRWHQEFKLLHEDYFEKRFQRASKYSKHINKNYSRCRNLEDELHMLFLCPFSKAAWFSYPWFINIEFIAEHHRSIPDLIQVLLTSQHPQITLNTLYTFLWCLWKAQNDTLFCRKMCNLPKCLRQQMQLLQEPQWRPRESSSD